MLKPERRSQTRLLKTPARRRKASLSRPRKLEEPRSRRKPWLTPAFLPRKVIRTQMRTSIKLNQEGGYRKINIKYLFICGPCFGSAYWYTTIRVRPGLHCDPDLEPRFNIFYKKYGNQENLPFYKSSMENVARKANVEKWKNDKKIFIKKSFCFLAFYPLGSGSRRISITRIRTQNTGTVFVLRYTVLFTQCTCAITTQKGRTYEIFLYFVRR